MIEIVHLSQTFEKKFADFLADINTPELKKFFHPHDLTPEAAKRLCGYGGRDEYYVAVHEGNIIGYGMLRGWDEGYENPSLGICVHPGHQGKGLGMALMNHLVAAARFRNAPEIILKVRRDNHDAIRLYRRVGFEMTDLDSVNLRGTYPLAPSPIKKSA